MSRTSRSSAKADPAVSRASVRISVFTSAASQIVPAGAVRRAAEMAVDESAVAADIWVDPDVVRAGIADGRAEGECRERGDDELLHGKYPEWARAGDRPT